MHILVLLTYSLSSISGNKLLFIRLILVTSRCLQFYQKVLKHKDNDGNLNNEYVPSNTFTIINLEYKNIIFEAHTISLIIIDKKII